MHTTGSTSQRTAVYIATLRALCILAICGSALQYAWAGAGAEKSSSAKQAPAQEDKGLGFSIESEMLTYRALESNSEAVACDIASYLSGAAIEFPDRPSGVSCDVKPASKEERRVILAPFDTAAFQDFRLWRAEMELMHELHERAKVLCPEPGKGLESTNKAGKVAKAAVSAAIPGGGSMLSIAQGLLGTVISSPSSNPVTGTIEDQAFMDGVARELRRLSVTVLMPSAYAPFTVAAPAKRESPFISGLSNLLDERACLIRKQAENDEKGPDETNIQQVVGEIDGYLGVLQGFTVPAWRSAGNSSHVVGKDGNASTKSPDAATPGASSETPQPVASVPTLTLLLAVLAGDDIARELGVDATSGLLAIDESSPHVLLIKALESGGTVASTGGLFSSKTRYSGGSVGTYALFNLDGELECSGNVYEYGGSVPSTTFEQDLRSHRTDTSKQPIFQNGGCRRPAGH